jgi:glycosyltransferase involved in cell wall biosynthesis
VIANGIDTDEFKPAPVARAHWRDLHGVVDESVIGLVGRFHPVKGVAEYLQAMCLLRDADDRPMRFLLAGPDMVCGNTALMNLVAQYQIEPQQIELLGPLGDVSQFLPALDLLVLASLREGTPNILLEAMACGVKTVATGVGDVERILDVPARVACPGDAADLASKIGQALTSRDDAAEQKRASTEREFVQRYYSTGQCMTAYLNTYQEILN